MSILKYLPLIILFYFSLKLLIKFIDENIICLKEQILKQEVEGGFISIKDLQKSNKDQFTKAIMLYLNDHNYKNLILVNNNSYEFIEIKGTLNKRTVYITAFKDNSSYSEDNINEISIDDIQKFLGRMLKNHSKHGIIISDTIFSNNSIEFINSFNTSSTNKIQLVDGYDLSKYLRLYKKNNVSMEVCDDLK